LRPVNPAFATATALSDILQHVNGEHRVQQRATLNLIMTMWGNR